ncbi:hypothetical protein RRG08_060444 [Elysia crispata]|uniref:Uncharacterized protein n=1 Tax=Elysia crispata TaxID=231223 RepID=A0AAE1AMK7_9GAST|nr:hypothetical protein RRG08_060444 [Elysia crispata]
MVAHFGTIFFAEPLISLGDHCAPRVILLRLFTRGVFIVRQGEGGIYQQRELKKGNNERWAKDTREMATSLMARPLLVFLQ